MPVIRIPVYSRKPTTASGALRQAHRLLSQEGRWIQGQWFKSKGSSARVGIDPEKPLCSQGWGACADGALQAVVFGLPTYMTEGACEVANMNDAPIKADLKQKQIYAAASEYLNDLVYPDYFVGFNDRPRTRRKDVLAVFWKAYRRAQYVERLARQSRQVAV